MKFCSVVPEICRGQVHGARRERRITRTRRRRIIIIIRNGTKTISLQTLFGRLNNFSFEGLDRQYDKYPCSSYWTHWDINDNVCLKLQNYRYFISNFNYEGPNIHYHSSSYRNRCDTSDTVCLSLYVEITYRSLQVYQRSYSQVGHRILSDFTLKIVRQNPPR